MITIGSNIASLGAQRKLAKASESLSTSLERLASGQRINRASDDAAGLSIAESLKADTRVYTQAVRNVNDGVSLLNIAEGALGQLTNIVTRQKELSEQAASGTYGPRQRVALHQEAFALTKEYNRIVQSTTFNGQRILDGTEDYVRLQHGYGQEMSTLAQLGSDFGVAAGDGTFHAAFALTTGTNPRGLTLADINGDGHADLISGDQGSNQLSLYLGNGIGTFQAATTLATAANPVSVTAADLNGDGLADLVSADSGSARLSIFIGNGNGTFRAATSLPTGNNPRQATVADLNGDGVLDLVSPAYGSNQLSIFLGNGDGSFRAASTLATGTNPRAVIATDLNGDGIFDLASADENSNQLSVYIGNGNGTFQATTTLGTSSNTLFVTASDLNGDGIADLVSADSGSSRLSVFLGNGNGTFKTPTTLATGSNPSSITSSDFNGDGVIDLVSADLGSNRLSLFIGNGNGSFQAAIIQATGTSPREVAVGDLNDDSVPDLVSADFSSNRLSVILGNQDSTGRRNNLQAPLDLTSIQGARVALDRTSDLLTKLAREQGAIGALQSRLQTVTANLGTARENFDAARSRIVDADIAGESAELTRGTILQQAASAVLAQANQQPGLALTLLRGA